MNRTIQSMIKHHVQKSDKLEWDEWLWAVAQSYNTTVHASKGCTPAKLFLSCGAELRLPLDLVYGTHLPRPKCLHGCPQGLVEQMRVSIQKTYAQAGFHLHQNALVQTSAHAKAGYRIRQYEVNQLVWRYYPPWANEKLSSAWTGPWVVQHQYPNTTVKVRLARGGVSAKDGSTLVVNASCLKSVGTTGDGKLLHCDESRIVQCPSFINLKETE